MPKLDAVEGMARAYAWFGIDLQGGSGNEQKADCPFCGKEGKWTVNCETGLWQCWSCQAGGNLTVFTRKVWELSVEQTTDYSELVAERPPLTEETLMHWEAAGSVLTGEWLLPGCGIDGKVQTVYKWAAVPGSKKKRLQLTPETHHYPSGYSPTLFDQDEELVYLVEGLWDGAAWWQALRQAKLPGNVVSVPGARVFKEGWCSIFSGKRVVLIPHNDHPREYPKDSGHFIKPGLDGMRRIAGILQGSDRPPKEMNYLKWGPDGFDPEKKDGYDLRDAIIEHVEPSLILDHWQTIPVPQQWLQVARKTSTTAVEVQAKHCDSWAKVLASWSEALHMRLGLEDVLAVCLAVCLSTEQSGDSQLFLQMIGDPGTAKTKFCDALLTSKKCIPLEHITGFHSGWSDGSGKDFSFLARSNRKTWITPEGDLMMSSPRFVEIMSQQRRIFDGTSRAVYKNKTEDQNHVGLRTPWIMAGTFALLETDQSRLGDRFLRVVVDQASDDERRMILRKVIMTSTGTVRQSSNGAVESHMDPKLAEAYRLTGGYVDNLRDNSDDLLSAVRVDMEQLIDRISALAEFVADMRSRPNPDKRKVDLEASKELPSRLASQLVRLAICLGAVTQRHEVDAEVMRIVAKVAVDTARGKTLMISRHLYEIGERGSSAAACAVAAGTSEDRTNTLIDFMQKLDMVERFEVPPSMGQRVHVRWRLTPRLRRLHDEVMSYA